MAELPYDLKVLVLTARLTGLRRGELLKLTKDCIHLDRRQIHVRDTKTNEPRFVPIPDMLVPVLRAVLAASPSEHVFVGESGRPLGAYVSHRFHAAVLKARIADLRFHDLRHDYATNLKRNNVSVEEISKILGYSTLAMTMRYAHIESERLQAAVNRMTPIHGAEEFATSMPLGGSGARVNRNVN